MPTVFRTDRAAGKHGAHACLGKTCGVSKVSFGVYVAKKRWGRRYLSENFEPIALSAYAELIIDPLTVQPNTRPVLTKLYSALANTANDETHFAEFSELQAHIEAFLYSVCEAQETELVFNGGLEAAQLFKAADVRFDFASERPLTERLLDYMRVNSQYLKTKVFLLYNIKDVLEKEELETLCQALFYNKILFLLVQSEAKYRVANETQWILDNDLCEIY